MPQTQGEALDLGHSLAPIHIERLPLYARVQQALADPRFMTDGKLFLSPFGVSAAEKASVAPAQVVFSAFTAPMPTLTRRHEGSILITTTGN